MGDNAMIFITVLDDGRVGAATTEERFSQGMVQVQEPEGFDFGSFSPRDWVYEDGNLKHDPLPEPDPPEDPVKIANDAKGIAEEAKEIAMQAGTDPQLQALATLQVASMSFDQTPSDEVVKFIDYWPEWKPDTSYKHNDPITYQGHKFRASKDLTSQAIYPPGTAESEYYEVTLAPDGIIVWYQPGGAYNQVYKGEKRHYPDADGPVYEALEDTTYSPDAYPKHWKLVGE